MKPLKIIFDAKPLTRDKTGIGNFTEQMILALSEKYGQDAKFVGYYIAPKSVNLSDKYRDYPNLEFRRINDVIALILRVLRRLNIHPPIDLMLGFKSDISLATNYVSMPLLFGGKSILFIYDLSFVDCPEFVAKRNQKYLKKWVAKRIKKADGVLTISNFVKARIVSEYGFPSDKILVTHIPPKPKSSAQDKTVFKELGLAGDYILFVGTIEPRKNINNLLLGYSELSKPIKDTYSLVLAGGDGWLDSEIKESLAALNSTGLKIYKTGYISEAKLAALYHKTTLVVQPSHYEGFGMPILEAMSYGKPVACSDIEVFREITSDGALFFNKDQPSDIADCLESALSDKKKLDDTAKAGAKVFKSYSDWKTVAKKFQEFMISR